MAMGIGVVLAVIAVAGAMLIPRLLTSHNAGPRPARLAEGKWVALPNLAAIRGATSGVLLPDGSALVVGGGVGSIPLAATEIFDPNSGTWRTAPPLHHARRGHAAVALKDGRVLVAGGLAAGEVLGSVESYDPARGAWTDVAPMSVPRFGHTLTLLADGRVLAAGGASSARGGSTDKAERSAEVYSPATNAWTVVPAGMLSARYQAVAASLGDGRVLLSGGLESVTATRALDTAELFDPAAMIFTRATSMGARRESHAGILLGDGRVLVSGGDDGESSVDTAEIFDPGRGTWTPAQRMSQARRLAGISLLGPKRVLVTGGESVQAGLRNSLQSAEVYDVGTGRWALTERMTCPRSAQAQVTLGTGKVLVAGGDAAFPGQPPGAQSCAELFQP
ncbi:MAG: hypothetical protein NVSMB17_15150 [Candidatus Dormibacteria bacterium]